MELFRPPQPKPEPPPPPPKTNEPPKAVVEAPKPGPQPPLPPPPISLFADATAGVPEPGLFRHALRALWPADSFQTVITVDSASIQTPIVGLITEDIYHAGLVIPAGTEVHGTAQTDRHRERIASGGTWTLVWQTGEELRLKGVALDREFSGDQVGWGITDGSAGLRGRILKTDDLAEIKLFAATLLSGAAAALTEKETTILGSIDSRSLNNAPLKGAQDVLKIYSNAFMTKRFSATDSMSESPAGKTGTSTSCKPSTARKPSLVGRRSRSPEPITAVSPPNEPLPPFGFAPSAPSASASNLKPGSQP